MMDQTENNSRQGIEWLSLVEGVEIAVSPQHRFTTDSVLLSRFASPRPRERCVELCSGCGAVSLLWFGKGEPSPAEVHCVELDSEASALLRMSVERNGLAGRIFPVCADLRALTGLSALPAGRFDLVVCNPPYFPPGPDAGGHDPVRRSARREIHAGIGDTAAAAARLLRFGGRFCCSWRPERLPDLFGALRKNRLEPKRIRGVSSREGASPSLFLVEASLGGGKELRWLPPLALLGPDGAPVEEYRAIYRMRG